MANVIMMARNYRVRPSELLGIEGEYAAFCFDEAAFYMLAEATDKDGKVNWNKFKWRGGGTKGNEDFVRFIEGRK